MYAIRSYYADKPAVKNVTFKVKAGEVVCVAGIDGNGQSDLVYALTGLEKSSEGIIKLNGTDITKASSYNFV